MGFFDRFRRKKGEAPPPSPATPSPAPRAPTPGLSPGGLPEPEPHPLVQFPRERIEALVLEQIGRVGVPGLSPEETELVKPFFVELFLHYHQRSQGMEAAWCSRKDHGLPQGKPVFVTGSGKILCERCAQEYVIGFPKDWTYYLGNIAAGIGPVPAGIQAQGSEIQAQIKASREVARVQRIDALEDQQELFRIVSNEEEDYETRRLAMSKLTDPALVRQVALGAGPSNLQLMALETPLDRETLAAILQSDAAFKVREAALKKTDDQQLIAKMALCTESRDLRLLAVRRLTDRAILAQVARSDPTEYVRQEAGQRLEELGCETNT